MNPLKLFITAAILIPANFLVAESGPDPVVKLSTQFGRQEFTPYRPDAEELLRIFDLDKNGKITPDERENMTPILVELLPKIKSPEDRVRLVQKVVKYWDPIPLHMSFFMDESWPILRTDFPPYAAMPDPNLPESVEVLTNPRNRRILVADSKTFPPRYSKPRPTIVSTLESPFQIKKRFDKNRDGILDENEAKDLLLEMRFKFTLAKSNGAREKIVERYAEALKDINADEYTVQWGLDSSFMIFKDPLSGRWHADAPPLTPIPFGEHPSTNFTKKLLEKDKSGLALAEFLDMLQRISPLDRADTIAKKLPQFLESEYPNGGTIQWRERACNIGYAIANNENEIADHDIERIIEYINDRHENVFTPIFYTDPEGAVDLIARISYDNQTNLSPEERTALDSYYKLRKQPDPPSDGLAPTTN